MIKKNDIPEPPETGTCDYYGMVRAFHKAVGHPAPDTIHPLTKKDRIFRCNLMAEEVIELAAEENMVEQVDALIDLLYFTFGCFALMGIDPKELFDVVHQSNMGKLWPSGEFKYNEKGKVVKPPTWERPEPQIHKILVERLNKQDADDKIPF